MKNTPLESRLLRTITGIGVVLREKIRLHAILKEKTATYIALERLIMVDFGSNMNCRVFFLLTLFRPGLFLVLWGRGGGGRFAPPLNSENTKLKGQIIRPKMFTLKSVTSADDNIWCQNNVLFSNGGHLGSAILDFLNFPKAFKNRQNWSRSDQNH